MTGAHTPSVTDDRCKCGRKYESYYSAFYRECQQCERYREAESALAADMMDRGFAARATSKEAQSNG